MLFFLVLYYELRQSYTFRLMLFCLISDFPLCSCFIFDVRSSFWADNWIVRKYFLLIKKLNLNALKHWNLLSFVFVNVTILFSKELMGMAESKPWHFLISNSYAELSFGFCMAKKGTHTSMKNLLYSLLPKCVFTFLFKDVST